MKKKELNFTVCQFPLFFWEIVKTYEVRGTKLSFLFFFRYANPADRRCDRRTDRHDKDLLGLLVQKFWKLKLSSGYMKDRIHENFIFFRWYFSLVWHRILRKKILPHFCMTFDCIDNWSVSPWFWINVKIVRVFIDTLEYFSYLTQGLDSWLTHFFPVKKTYNCVHLAE